jgi:hypothetical protein
LEILRCPIVRRDVHALFDTGRFILLPDEDVVQTYQDGGKPDFDGDVRDLIPAQMYVCVQTH